MEWSPHKKDCFVMVSEVSAWSVCTSSCGVVVSQYIMVGRKLLTWRQPGSKERLEGAELPLPLLGHFPVPRLGAFLFSYEIVCFITTFSYMNIMNFNNAHNVPCTVYTFSYFPRSFCSVSNNTPSTVMSFVLNLDT